MKKVAITGNIGSGKTTISKFLLEKNLEFLSATMKLINCIKQRISKRLKSFSINL